MFGKYRFCISRKSLVTESEVSLVIPQSIQTDDGMVPPVTMIVFFQIFYNLPCIIRAIRVTSGVPQGSVLDPLLFLAYVNDIWRNSESNIRLFADDCIIYRKIMDSSDIDNLPTNLNRLI